MNFGKAKFCIAALAALVLTACGQGDKSSKLIIKLPYAEGTPASFLLSPDGSRAAYIKFESLRGGEADMGGSRGEWMSYKSAQVVLDDQAGPKHATVHDLKFSANGAGFAYLAEDDGQACVILNGIEQKRYAKIFPESLKFSPAGSRVAYKAFSAGREIAVTDGTELAYNIPNMDPFFFSFDGRHVAFEATDGSQYFMVIDGTAGEKFDQITSGTCFFSPLGSPFFYEARRGEERFFLADHQKQALPNPMAFSPDGKRWASELEENGKQYIVIEGQKSRAYDRIYSWSLVFSKDSSHYAFLAKKSNLIVVVVDGAEVKSYPSSEFPDSLSGESEMGTGISHHAAHIPGEFARTEHFEFRPFQGLLVYIRDHHECLVVNGEVGKIYNEISDFSLSPDGSRTAFVAKLGDEVFVVVNEKEETSRFRQKDFYISGLVLNRDGSRYAYVANSTWGDPDRIFADGQMQWQASNISSLAFSLDGKHLIAVGQDIGENYLFIDGKKGRPFDEVFVKTLIESSGMISFTARKGKNIFRIEENF